MNKRQIVFVSFISGIYFAVALTANAEKIGVTNEILFTEKDDHVYKHVPAKTILERNKILLENSDIGRTLKKSPNPKAQAFFNDAEALYQKAHDYYQSGEQQAAKDVAVNSILVVIKSVEEHYKSAK